MADRPGWSVIVVDSRTGPEPEPGGPAPARASTQQLFIMILPAEPPAYIGIRLCEDAPGPPEAQARLRICLIGASLISGLLGILPLSTFRPGWRGKGTPFCRWIQPGRSPPAQIGPMTRQQVRARIEEVRIIAAVRAANSDDALFAAEAVSRGGIPIVELTTTVPSATELIAHLIKKHPHMVVGAGTVLDLETGRACLAAGAKFIASPGLDLEFSNSP